MRFAGAASGQDADRRHREFAGRADRLSTGDVVESHRRRVVNNGAGPPGCSFLEWCVACCLGRDNASTAAVSARFSHRGELASTSLGQSNGVQRVRSGLHLVGDLVFEFGGGAGVDDQLAQLLDVFGA